MAPDDLERYQALVEAAADGMYMLDADGRITMVNDALLSETGHERDELIGEHVSAFMTDEDVERGEGVIRELLRDDERDWETYEIELDVGGEDRIYEDSITVRTDESGEFLGSAGVIRDVTERKRRARELERYRTAVETAGDSIYALDEDGFITMVNEAHVDYSGHSREKLLGSHVLEFMSDEEVEKGTEVIAELLDAEGERRGSFTFTAERSDGDVRTYEDTVALIETDDGEFVGSVGIVRDITERTEREETIRDQNDQLEILNRIVRHDIRNDMNVVRGHADLLEPAVDDDARDHLEVIDEIADEVIELTEAIGDLTESITTGELELNPIDLRGMLDNEIQKAAMAFDDATFEREEFPEVFVRANRMLSSVFSNLLTNAVRHNDTAVPTVEISVDDREETVRVIVADDGPGVPDDRKATVFGRGKKGLESPGSGIGLYLVYTLVDQYGGSVWIEDNEPRGARFVVELEKVD